MQRFPDKHISLCEALDRTLNKGVVVNGELTISVADIDLIYLGLRVILTSTETALNMKKSAAIGKLVESYLKKEEILNDTTKV